MRRNEKEQQNAGAVAHWLRGLHSAEEISESDHAYLGSGRFSVCRTEGTSWHLSLLDRVLNPFWLQQSALFLSQHSRDSPVRKLLSCFIPGTYWEPGSTGVGASGGVSSGLYLSATPGVSFPVGCAMAP